MATANGRASRLLIKALAVYTAIVVPLITTVILVGSHDPRARAIILMGASLVFFWCLVGGSLTLRYRNRLRDWMLHLPLRWEWRFLLLATALALVEEAITTTLTNLAPELGSQIGVAYITASNNYLIVVAFSSVVLFVPEFAGWDSGPPEMGLHTKRGVPTLRAPWDHDGGNPESNCFVCRFLVLRLRTHGLSASLLFAKGPWGCLTTIVALSPGLLCPPRLRPSGGWR